VLSQARCGSKSPGNGQIQAFAFPQLLTEGLQFRVLFGEPSISVSNSHHTWLTVALPNIAPIGQDRHHSLFSGVHSGSETT
jgi:hypothetical protein